MVSQTQLPYNLWDPLVHPQCDGVTGLPEKGFFQTDTGLRARVQRAVASAWRSIRAVFSHQSDAINRLIKAEQKMSASERFHVMRACIDPQVTGECKKMAAPFAAELRDVRLVHGVQERHLDSLRQLHLAAYNLAFPKESHPVVDDMVLMAMHGLVPGANSEKSDWERSFKSVGVEATAMQGKREELLQKRSRLVKDLREFRIQIREYQRSGGNEAELRAAARRFVLTASRWYTLLGR